MTEKLNPEKVEVVRAIYTSANRARTSVYGGSRTLGRAQSYGYRKPGDVFDVLVNDVIARPGMFNAYPCDKPFTINGTKLENPCGDVGVKEQHGMLTDIPGIGPKIAKRLVGLGIVNQDDVLNNVDDEILNKLPPNSRTSIQKWQESQGH